MCRLAAICLSCLFLMSPFSSFCPLPVSESFRVKSTHTSRQEVVCVNEGSAWLKSACSAYHAGTQTWDSSSLLHQMYLYKDWDVFPVWKTLICSLNRVPNPKACWVLTMISTKVLVHIVGSGLFQHQNLLGQLDIALFLWSSSHRAAVIWQLNSWKLRRNQEGHWRTISFMQEHKQYSRVKETGGSTDRLGHPFAIGGAEAI